MEIAILGEGLHWKGNAREANLTKHRVGTLGLMHNRSHKTVEQLVLGCLPSQVSKRISQMLYRMEESSSHLWMSDIGRLLKNWGEMLPLKTCKSSEKPKTIRMPNWSTVSWPSESAYMDYRWRLRSWESFFISLSCPIQICWSLHVFMVAILSFIESAVMCSCCSGE